VRLGLYLFSTLFASYRILKSLDSTPCIQ
jgi:hypothetical protein